jgi:nucleoside phosphorylase
MSEPDINGLLNEIDIETENNPKIAVRPLSKDIEIDVLTSKPEIRTSTKIDLSDDRTGQSSPKIQLPTILIITALDDPEYRVVRQILGCEWLDDQRGGFTYTKGTVELCGNPTQIVVACQNEMGMVEAAILTTKAIIEWRPLLVVMIGICAGSRDRGISLGDIIVANKVLDYGSGKKEGNSFKPSYSPIQLDNICVDQVKTFIRNNEDIGDRIRSQWHYDGGKPNTALRIHFGDIASGASVIAIEGFFEDLQQYHRNILGIDMEAYAVAKAVQSHHPNGIKWMIIKGVQDFADSEKSDDYREYSAFVSVQFLIMFLKEHMSALAT